MHADTERRLVRARAEYSARHFELEGSSGDSYQGECTNRDPRMDPQPGDILAVDRDVREVIDRVQDSIEYGFPNRAASRWLPLIRWQAWARVADVKKAAV